MWSFSLRFSSLESVNASLSNCYILLIAGDLILAKKYRFYLRNMWRKRLIGPSAVHSFRFKVLYLLLYLVFLFAVFIVGISECFSIQLLYSFDCWGFDSSEKVPFLFTKRVAEAFDLPFSSSIFQIQIFFLSSVVLDLSLCGFLLTIFGISESFSNWNILFVSSPFYFSKKSVPLPDSFDASNWFTVDF